MDKTIPFTKQKLNILLLLTLSISLGFGQLSRLAIYGLPEFYVHDLLVIFLLLLNIRSTFTRKPNAITRAIYQFSVVILLSLVFNWEILRQNPLVMLYAGRTIAYLLLYPALVNFKIEKGRALHMLLLTGVIATTIAYTQYFLLPDVRFLVYLGWDDHLNRATFPYFDPTFTGSMIALMSLLALAHKKYILSFLSLPAILLTYARSVFISFTISVIVSVRRMRLWLFLGIIVGVLILPKRFGEGTNLLRTFSINSRIDRDIAVLEIAHQQPILGVGMNGLPILLEEDSLYTSRSNTANNSYIYLYATTGLIGLYALINLLFQLVKKSPYKGVWTYVLVASLFNNVLFYPFVMVWIILLESLTLPRKE